MSNIAFRLGCLWLAGGLLSAGLLCGDEYKPVMSPGERFALADALAADPPIVLLGDVEETPQFDSKSKPEARSLTYAYWGFGLTKVKVRKLIRAKVPVAEVILVQLPDLRPTFKKGWRASLGDDGRTKLMFLVPGGQLHEYTTYTPLGDKVEAQKIRDAAQMTDPQMAFAKLGLAAVLNAKSWFEAWDGRGSFETKTNLPSQVRPPVTPSPPGQFSYWRARQADEKYVFYMLPVEFLADLEILLQSHAVVEGGDEAGIGRIRAKLRSEEAREVLDQWAGDARKRSKVIP